MRWFNVAVCTLVFALVFLAFWYTRHSEKTATEVKAVVEAAPEHKHAHSAPVLTPSAVPLSNPTPAAKIKSDPVLEALKEMPSVAEVQESLPKDQPVHGHPDAVIKAAALLGDIKARLTQDPEYKTEALTFYNQCALNHDWLESVRALCVANLDEIDHEAFLSIEDQIPSRVKEIAASLNR